MCEGNFISPCDKMPPVNKLLGWGRSQMFLQHILNLHSSPLSREELLEGLYVLPGTSLPHMEDRAQSRHLGCPWQWAHLMAMVRRAVRGEVSLHWS